MANPAAILSIGKNLTKLPGPLTGWYMLLVFVTILEVKAIGNILQGKPVVPCVFTKDVVVVEIEDQAKCLIIAHLIGEFEHPLASVAVNILLIFMIEDEPQMTRRIPQT